MILDNLQNWRLYSGYAKRMDVGFDYLLKTDLANLQPGKLPIQGDDVYAVVVEPQTKPREQGKWESHRKYIDIQYLVRGVEQMGYANLGSLKVIHPYEEKDDYLLFEGDGSFFILRAGQFAVFGPEDAHMPGIALGTPAPVKKVVIKVRVD